MPSSLRTRRLRARYVTPFGLLLLAAAAACSSGSDPDQTDHDDGGADAASPSDAAHDSSLLDAGPGSPDATDARADATNGDADAEVDADAADDPVDGAVAADAGPDADAAPPSPVTMNVTLGGAPEPGVLVVFNDAQGAILSSGTTDATGAFAAIVPSGSQVTVVFVNTGVRIETVTGLEPGDVLHATDLAPRSVTLDIDSIPDNPPADAARGLVLVGSYSDCAQTMGVSDTVGIPFDFAFPIGCAQSDVVSPIFLAYDSTYTEIGYTFQKNVALDGNGVDGGGIPVNVTHPWAPSATMTLTTPITALPLGSLAYEESSGGTVDESSFAPGMGSQDEDMDAGIYMTTSTMHPDYPDAVQIEATVYEVQPTQAAFLSFQGRATRIPPPTSAGTLSVDLSNLLPAITAASYTGNVGTPTAISWTTAAPLSDADGLVVWFDGMNAGNAYATWTVFGPATATSCTLPTLPPSAANLAPSTVWAVLPTTFAVDVSFFAGYADFKTTFESFSPGAGLLSEPGFGLVPILPALGSARITSLSTN
jgi:hypothetical protein